MKKLLITGATGSLGKALVSYFLKEYSLERIVIFSRDELKQWEMMKSFSPDIYTNIRYFIGDIRDKERLTVALKDIDTVIHAAALKQVPAAEYNPMEFIKTNVVGSNNLINACIECGVSRVVAVSTDKAAAPINLYGATKLCADKLFVAANNVVGNQDMKFCVVRYGNVMGSRGSVIPYFIDYPNKEYLPITDSRMTRFNITLDYATNLIANAIETMIGGEIFVPKLPSYRIIDVASAISPEKNQKIVGLRPGEKIHEEMITASDSYSTIDLGELYAILPADGKLETKYKERKISFQKVEEGFSYNSGKNKRFLTIEELTVLIHRELDFISNQMA